MSNQPIIPGECLFCRIGSGALRPNVIYESPNVVAFLDINPIRTGHTQIIPRRHYPYYDDLPPEIACEIMSVGQRLAPVLRHLFGAPRVAFLYTGGDIAHAHAHVVPMHESTDITSRQYIVESQVTFRAAARASDAELARAAARIAHELQSFKSASGDA